MATAATLHATPAHNLISPSASTNPIATRPITTIPRGDVQSEITFYAPPLDGSSPFNYVETPPPGQPQRNYSSETAKLTIHDARGHESDFNTDNHGFALVNAASSIPSEQKEVSFTDDSSITTKYYDEVTNLLKDKLGANSVFIFDHTIRRSGADAKRGPVNRAHIDQTPRAAEMRVRRHLPDQADELLQGRYRIVNVWRPLNGPVVAQPLAMAASDSVPAEAVVPVQHRYPDRVGETAGIANKGSQEWWYWSGMKDDERILLQCFDSQSKKRVAHTAFADPRTEGPEWRGRESIEVRALVFG